jgi:hypothetical protein
VSTDERWERAQAAFERMHEEDPQRVTVDGGELPFAVHYHRRLSHWVEALCPEASEPLRLAARCQHVRRWTLSRAEFPEGVEGYKRWRSTLARMHAEVAREVLREAGYGDEVGTRVTALLMKKGLRSDGEVQSFEDAVCLVFLENQLSTFADKHADDKLVDILKKTWRKMTPRGHEAARALAERLPVRSRALLTRALET